MQAFFMCFRTTIGLLVVSCSYGYTTDMTLYGYVKIPDILHPSTAAI